MVSQFSMVRKNGRQLTVCAKHETLSMKLVYTSEVYWVGSLSHQSASLAMSCKSFRPSLRTRVNRICRLLLLTYLLLSSFSSSLLRNIRRILTAVTLASFLLRSVTVIIGSDVPRFVLTVFHPHRTRIPTTTRFIFTIYRHNVKYIKTTRRR